MFIWTCFRSSAPTTLVAVTDPGKCRLGLADDHTDQRVMQDAQWAIVFQQRHRRALRKQIPTLRGGPPPAVRRSLCVALFAGAGSGGRAVPALGAPGHLQGPRLRPGPRGDEPTPKAEANPIGPAPAGFSQVGSSLGGGGPIDSCELGAGVCLLRRHAECLFSGDVSRSSSDLKGVWP